MNTPPPQMQCDAWLIDWPETSGTSILRADATRPRGPKLHHRTTPWLSSQEKGRGQRISNNESVNKCVSRVGINTQYRWNSNLVVECSMDTTAQQTYCKGRFHLRSIMPKVCLRLANPPTNTQTKCQTRTVDRQL